MSAADTPPPSPPLPPVFDAEFRASFETLILWRRDVRRFRRDAVDPALVHRLMALADRSPSVGNSQPWRFVLVEGAALRDQVRAEFRRANAEALAAYHGEQAALYAQLKLSGLEEAPVHLAVFVDPSTEQGAGLGRHTMPETIGYSAVAAIHTLWLGARAWGLGVGWVSIFDPKALTHLLDLPASWHLVGYLCLGYPEEEHIDPELERHGWQARTDLKTRIFVKP